MGILSSKYEKKLAIFENFKIDGNLPKYTQVPEDEVNAINRGQGRNFNTAVYTGGTAFSDTSYISITSPSSTTGIVSPSTIYVTTDNGDTNNSVSYPPALEDQAVTSDDIVITLSEFFGYVRYNGGFVNTLSNLRYKRKVKALEKLIKQCEQTGQASLKDLSMAELDRLKLEYILAAKGFRTFVDECHLVEAFLHLSDKDQDLIELEWLKDFNRIIPQKLIKRKEKADKCHVFDNYVIMHIRPGWYGSEIERLTKEETDRRKDPILFGVMNCSRRLYYLGDWIDSECNLTLGELIDKMGDKGLEVNEIWSRTDPSLPFEGAKFMLPKMEKEIN